MKLYYHEAEKEILLGWVSEWDVNNEEGYSNNEH